MNLATARSELLDIIGADLENDEANRLLNDGNKELCVRAEWTRATLALGNTVANQRDYELPANVSRVLKFRVNGQLWNPTDEEEADDLLAGDLVLVNEPGRWWLSGTASGTDQFSLYPTPTTGGLAMTALCVIFPETITDDEATFTPPEDYHQAPIYYAAARSIGGSEDDLDMRAYYLDQFDGFVGRLRRLRKSRRGNGPVSMRIRGLTA